MALEPNDPALRIEGHVATCHRGGAPPMLRFDVATDIRRPWVVIEV